MGLNLEEGDWVPVFRKIRKSWLWRDPEALRAWMDLLMMANYHEGTMPHKGHPLPIEPGQVATTYQAMADRFGWSRHRVRRFIERLAQEGSVEFKRLKFNPTVTCEKRPDEQVKSSGTSEKTDGWIETDSDRSILLLTLVNSPVRKKWLTEHEAGNAFQKTVTLEKRPDEPVKSSGKTVKVCHNPILEIREKGDTGTAPVLGTGGSLEIPVLTPLDHDPEMVRTLEEFQAFKSPGMSSIAITVRDLANRQGIPHEEIRATVRAHPKSGFYAIVRLLEKRKPEIPYRAAPVLSSSPKGPSGEESRRRQDEAREKVDRELRKTDPALVSQWKAEIEEEFRSTGAMAFVSEGTLQGALRARAAQKYGIEGV